MIITRMFKILILVVFILTFAAAGGLYYVLTTTDGLRTATHFALERFVTARVKTVESIEGTLADGAVFKNIELSGFEGLPAGSIIRVQELAVTQHGLNYKNADVVVRNARVKLPVSENIVLDGTYQGRHLEAAIFSPAVDLHEIFTAAHVKARTLKYLNGSLRDIDLKVTGPIEEPRLAGRFLLEELSHRKFKLRQSPGSLDLKFTGRKRNMKINGEVALEKGDLQARKTKVELKPSRVYFSGDPKDPALSLEGFSRIDTLEIDILVKGTAKKPDLRLTSDPPLSKEELMVTLASGRRWEGFQGLEQGEMSIALVKDLAAFMFSPDSDGEGFFDRMGISDVRVTMEEGAKGIGVKKEITADLDVGYEVEQKTGAAADPQTAQTMSADYRISNAFYAGIEHKLQVTDTLNTNEPDAADNRFLMKYKTRF